MQQTASSSTLNFAGNTEHVGRVLRIWRAEKGLTQAGVAKAIGISSQQFQKYETGNSRIELSRLFEICRVFGKSPSEILRISDGPPKLEPELNLSHLAASAELTSQADLSFQISELVSSFLAIKTSQDRKTALYLMKCISEK